MMFAAAPDQRFLIGYALTIALVILPAFPLGPLFATPPLPLAGLWLAQGLALREAHWRGLVALALIGLLNDQIAGYPLGLMPFVFLIAYFASALLANVTRSVNLFSEWAAFCGVVAAACASGFVLLAILGQAPGLPPIALAGASTALLYPLIRGFYVDRSLTRAA